MCVLQCIMGRVLVDCEPHAGFPCVQIGRQPDSNDLMVIQDTSINTVPAATLLGFRSLAIHSGPDILTHHGREVGHHKNFMDTCRQRHIQEQTRGYLLFRLVDLEGSCLPVLSCGVKNHAT